MMRSLRASSGRLDKVKLKFAFDLAGAGDEEADRVQIIKLFDLLRRGVVGFVVNDPERPFAVRLQAFPSGL